MCYFVVFDWLITASFCVWFCLRLFVDTCFVVCVGIVCCFYLFLLWFAVGYFVLVVMLICPVGGLRLYCYLTGGCLMLLCLFAFVCCLDVCGTCEFLVCDCVQLILFASWWIWVAACVGLVVGDCFVVLLVLVVMLVWILLLGLVVVLYCLLALLILFYCTYVGVLACVGVSWYLLFVCCCFGIWLFCFWLVFFV